MPFDYMRSPSQPDPPTQARKTKGAPLLTMPTDALSKPTTIFATPTSVDPDHNPPVDLPDLPDLEPLLPPLPDKLTFTFAELRAAGDAMGERKDCAVIATCVVTGYAYPKIHEMYRLVGRRARCGTPWVYTIGVLAQLGLRLVDISKFYDGASIRSIVPQLPSKGKFLVSSRKHVSAVIDGVCEDWADERKLYVQGIYQVVDMDDYDLPVAPAKPKRKVYIDYSQPTKAVWAIAEILLDDPTTPAAPAIPTRRYWSTFRAKVIAECVGNGIHKTTAAVQVGKWMADKGLVLGYMSA
jgi:hypothetical protein